MQDLTRIGSGFNPIN